MRMNWLNDFDSRIAGRFVGRSIARIEKTFTGDEAARNLKILGLLALPWAAFMVAALRRNPRQMWAQRWPTIIFVGLYEIALDRCVRIEGIENLPQSGPVILAGNHINKSAMDGMLLGSKILRMRGGLSKFVSIADPDSWMLRHFVRLMGESEGVVLPIQKGMTTETMIQFLENPAAFHREQSILGIFPVGEADWDFEKHTQKEWHTSAAVAAYATGAPIVPFYIEGLPYAWGPLDILKAIARSPVAGKPFKFTARLGKPIRGEGAKHERNYRNLTERVRTSVEDLALGFGQSKGQDRGN
jgi:1-acyl-sn-glycerol-3-phosphate acyltransferase